MPELAITWHEGWLWLGGSLLLAALWANLTWFFRRPRPGKIGEFVNLLTAWRFSPWALQFLRLLYYIGMPFAALLWGHDAVIGRLLGLQRLDLSVFGGEEASANTVANWIDWTHDVGWAAVLGIGTWGLLALGWWAYSRALVAAGVTTDGGETTPRADTSGWIFLREAAYHEVHWAFYRNMPILATGPYWGVWIGLALVALEAALNPTWRTGLTDPQRAPVQLSRGALAILSSMLFLLTQNLWLVLALHWAVSWGLALLARTLPLSPSRESGQIPA